jgi:hypothetical protein
MKCKECYSDNPRITPVRDPEYCLSNHLQYICSKCGRCICIGLKGEKKARCLMPFGSFDTAMFYLKAAEIMNDGVCGIYELIYSRGDKRYRIFETKDDLIEFLKRNPQIKCEKYQPIYISKKHYPVSEKQIRHLKKQEVEKYLNERKKMI